MTDVAALLEKVKSGEISVDEAVLVLKQEPFTDLGFAKIDMHRAIRQGAGEVIYGAGKTAEQIVRILQAMKEKGQDSVLVTRIDDEKAEEIDKALGGGFRYDRTSRAGIFGEIKEPDGNGPIAVVTAGTSDLPVAEEAALTAQFLGNEVIRIYDAGVSGLHRLLSHMDELMSASVVIAIAGMEGALASVVGGLVSCPVIAVPTSVGYGAAFEGLAALLAMLNSCASGVTVVNIDNGFGAGYSASRINHQKEKRS